MAITRAEIEKRFLYHAPTEDKRRRHEEVNRAFSEFAVWFCTARDEIGPIVPEGREQSLFLTKLEEARSWANAAIAREGQ